MPNVPMPVGGPIRHARQCTRTCSSPGNTTLPARCPPGLSARSASPRFNLSASARAADHAASASREAPRGGVSKFLWIAWGPSPQGPGWAAPSSGGHRGQGTSVSQGGPQCHGRTGAKCCAPLPRAVRLGKCTRTPTRTHTHTHSLAHSATPHYQYPRAPVPRLHTQPKCHHHQESRTNPGSLYSLPALQWLQAHLPPEAAPAFRPAHIPEEASLRTCAKGSHTVAPRARGILTSFLSHSGLHMPVAPYRRQSKSWPGRARIKCTLTSPAPPAVPWATER
jgi:hypothetical protein